MKRAVRRGSPKASQSREFRAALGTGKVDGMEQVILSQSLRSRSDRKPRAPAKEIRQAQPIRQRRRTWPVMVRVDDPVQRRYARYRLRSAPPARYPIFRQK